MSRKKNEQHGEQQTEGDAAAESSPATNRKPREKSPIVIEQWTENNAWKVIDDDAKFETTDAAKAYLAEKQLAGQFRIIAVKWSGECKEQVVKKFVLE